MRVTAGVLAGVLGLAVLAGCADNQPGDTNNGPGYTNNVADLLVKVPALDSDPCRSKQDNTIWPNCGRYVTEVANTIGALRDDLPGQTATLTTLQAAVTRFQQLGCDTVTGAPTALQQGDCPATLTTIGGALDVLGTALAALPTSN
jgi:hypothetical protein